MSRYEFRLPDIGEGVAEGEVVAWHVAAGQPVAEDQPMVDVMTDKATVSIGAPRGGQVAELRVPVGSVAKVGEVLVVIELPGAEPGQPVAGSAAPSSAAPPVASAVGDIRESLPGASFFAQPAQAAPPVQPAPALATPATRRLAREQGVDLQALRGSGPAGQVLRVDVEGHTRRAPASADNAVPATERRIPWVGVRRAIAERLSRAKQEAVHCTFVEECDVTRLGELRASVQEVAQAQNLRCTFLPFIIRAVAGALRRHPMLNSRLDAARGELVLLPEVHLGIATATDDGLLVPVLRHADRLRILELAQAIERLATGARQRTLTPGELSGSTFTITSLGQRGGLLATPILNHPEVGILGVHRIRKKPVVRDQQIVIGELMTLSLTFDHRIVDGDAASAFVYDLIADLENPYRMFRDAI